MEPNKKRAKFWLSITGTILLGALGSGLWSLLEIPLWKVSNWFLSATTLGITSIRDDMYAKAAFGLHELPSLYLLLFVCVLMFVMPVLPSLTPSMRSVIRGLVTKGESDPSPEDVLRRAKKLLYVTALIGALSGSYFIVKFMMVNQENLIASYFRQYVTVVRPYTSESEYIRLNSAFSQMKSKHDYVILMSHMQAIAKQNGVELPEAHTW
jgi:hypothetical protein